MDVVVVESPAKAKTINKYLGKNYKVLASFGHVRDLPAKDGSVRPDEDFAMSWEVDGPSAKRLTEIAKAVKDADGLILATDPDREGEAISWHVLEVLKQKRALKDKPVSRVVFNAITKQSVLDAMANPRQIDAPLVDAYLARRALDYLVGFTLSPVLWRKLPGARSAGRVQSVALRLVCDRESEIERFIREEYWQIAALLKTPRNDGFEARLTGLRTQEAAEARHLQQGAGRRHRGHARRRDASGSLSVEAKPTKRNPGPPFTTSTLQQAASSQLGFSATRTMQIAQRLYEGIDVGGETAGLITYMRTDGVQMAPEAIDAARARDRPRVRREISAGKAALLFGQGQECAGSARSDPPDRFLAHAGLGPPVSRCRPGAALRDDLEARHRQPDAAGRDRAHDGRDRGRQRRAAPRRLRAVGSVIRFDGFIAAYTDQKEDDSEDEEEPPPARNPRRRNARARTDQRRPSTRPNRRRAIRKRR